MKTRSLLLYKTSLGITGFSVIIFIASFVIVQAVSLSRFRGCTFSTSYLIDCDDHLKWIHYALIGLGVILIVMSFTYIAYMCQFYIGRSKVATSMMSTEMNSFQNQNMNVPNSYSDKRY